ncbi:putative gustatory receptor 98a [Linepithema humile]|uniref:putative gustatory receptor 98a n=1 Tax=Linepithema humile TaxID=83485 RepID=UPI0006238D09|nr:PREDICTED: putative gustatory receptor 2a [Linepithema humile]
MFGLLSKFQERIKNKVRKRWRWLFHATDFYSLMFPCFIFSRMLGIFPYKFNGSSFETSKSRYILSSVVIGVFGIFLFIMFYNMDISGDIQLDGVPDALQGNCYYTLGGFITIVTYILCGSRMRVLQSVMEVSLTLPPKSYRELSKIIHAKDIVGFVFLFGQIANCRAITIIHAMSKLLGLYVTLLVFQMDMLYMNCVCVLKACFQAINDNLTTLRELVINDEPRLLMRIYDERNSVLLMKLKTLQKWHLKISDTVQMLNVIFSLQLLATVVMTFVEITFSLYFYIVRLVEKVSVINLDKQIWYSYIATSVTYYFIKLALIVWSCETSKNQALRIGTSVHDVLQNTKDKQIKHELESFSLQILHRDNTFSAKGFTVDAKLLTSIVGSICTYLLILIQFMNAKHFCDDPSSSNVTQIFQVENNN